MYGPCERVSLWVKIEEANLIIVINVRKDGGKGKGEWLDRSGWKVPHWMDPVHRKKYFYGGYKSADNGATVALFATNLAPPLPLLLLLFLLWKIHWNFQMNEQKCWENSENPTFIHRRSNAWIFRRYCRLPPLGSWMGRKSAQNPNQFNRQESWSSAGRLNQRNWQWKLDEINPKESKLKLSRWMVRVKWNGSSRHRVVGWMIIETALANESLNGALNIWK